MDYEEPSRSPRASPKTQAMLDFKEVTTDDEGETKTTFAVAVSLYDPDNENDDLDEGVVRPRPKVDRREAEAYLVGTILKLGEKSATIWFGWGGVAMEQVDSTSPRQSQESKGRFMGSFVVATPKRAYKGAFDDSNSASKLIGTESVHNDLVAINMASRLSEKLQMAIFCSCNLDDGRPDGALGGETEMYLLQSRAAAIAEREIVRIVMADKTTS